MSRKKLEEDTFTTKLIFQYDFNDKLWTLLKDPEHSNVRVQPLVTFADYIKQFDIEIPDYILFARIETEAYSMLFRQYGGRIILSLTSKK